MESGQRNHDDNFKLSIYLKITQLQLEVDDSGNILLCYLNIFSILVPPGVLVNIHWLSSLYYKW